MITGLKNEQLVGIQNLEIMPLTRELVIIGSCIIKPMGLWELDWCSRMIPVLKPDGSIEMVVTDFKNINRCIKRPTHPTDSSNQLVPSILQHLIARQAIIR